MGVNDINFLNFKTILRISSIEAAVRRKTLRYYYFLLNFKFFLYSLAPFPTVSFQFDYGFLKENVNFSLENNLIYLYFENSQKIPERHLEKIKSRSIQGDIYYKFNSGKNISNKLIDFKNQKITGKNGGLTAEIFIGRPDQFKVDSFDTHTSFFSLYIHNLSLDAVQSTDDPIELTPGLSTSLKIRRVFKQRLSYPYNDCIDTDHLSLLESYDSELVKYILTKTKGSYRQKDCFDLCQSRHRIKMCNLSSTLLGFRWEVDWNHNNPICTKYEYFNFLKKDLNKLCLKDCPLECNSIEFEIETMTSKYPSQAYYLELMNNSKIKSNYPLGYNITLEDLRESMVQFSVYYTDFDYTFIGQIPKQELVDLVSNFGGLFGLFIGISFLSFGELIEIIIEILIILCEKKGSVNTK